MLNKDFNAKKSILVNFELPYYRDYTKFDLTN